MTCSTGEGLSLVPSDDWLSLPVEARIESLAYVNHEAVTTVPSGVATFSIFPKRTVLDFSYFIIMSKFGLLDRGDIDMMPYEDILRCNALDARKSQFYLMIVSSCCLLLLNSSTRIGAGGH